MSKNNYFNTQFMYSSLFTFHSLGASFLRCLYSFDHIFKVALHKIQSIYWPAKNLSSLRGKIWSLYPSAERVDKNSECLYRKAENHQLWPRSQFSVCSFCLHFNFVSVRKAFVRPGFSPTFIPTPSETFVKALIASGYTCFKQFVFLLAFSHITISTVFGITRISKWINCVLFCVWVCPIKKQAVFVFKGTSMYFWVG